MPWDWSNAPPGAEEAWRKGIEAFAGRYARGSTAERVKAVRRVLRGFSDEVVAYLLQDEQSPPLSPPQEEQQEMFPDGD